MPKFRTGMGSALAGEDSIYEIRQRAENNKTGKADYTQGEKNPLG